MSLDFVPGILSPLECCTLCDSRNIEIQFIKNNCKILHCKDCHHVFTGCTLSLSDIMQIYSDAYFFDEGPGYNGYILQKDILIKRGRYYADKIAKHTSPGTVLDVGSAAGFTLKGFQNNGWIVTGLEPNATMAAYSNNVLGISTIQGLLGNVAIEEKFNLIILLQIIGHIPDVKKAIGYISRYLNPGGYFLIETWNKDSITAKLFGKHWHEYIPPTTLNYFSKKSLKTLLLNNNFDFVDGGRPKKVIYSTHAKSFVSFSLQKSKNFKWISKLVGAIPDGVKIPYPAEDLFWSLFKKTN